MAAEDDATTFLRKARKTGRLKTVRDLKAVQGGPERPAQAEGPPHQRPIQNSNAQASSPDWGRAAAPFALPITDVLDLHTFAPRDIAAAVEAYLEEAHRLGLRALRIIHGRGIGVQRETTRKILSRSTCVESFADAPAEAGGWGATIVTFRD